MTAAIAAPIAMPLQLSDPSAEARKRRREILASQRSQVIDVDLEATSQVLTAAAGIELPAPVAKRQKMDEAEKSKKSAKKPQMKYDPDVPMTKEEATAWRREQRRKRNRESAAASRQRQRDRITELEVEVEEWKYKYEAIMGSIKQLEESSGKVPSDLLFPEQSQPLPESYSKFVSPPASPGHSPVYEPVASPIASSSLITSVTQVTPKEHDLVIHQMSIQVESEHSDNMISRQAVKITEAPTFPLLPSSSDDCILPPDSCLSAPSEVKLEPIETSIPPLKQQRLPNLLTDEENEDELGEFLLDAVQWL